MRLTGSLRLSTFTLVAALAALAARGATEDIPAEIPAADLPPSDITVAETLPEPLATPVDKAAGY